MNETLYKIFVGTLLISLFAIIIAIVATIIKFANKCEKNVNINDRDFT
jgi:hypothetical protein